jgi:hypothetical protein
MKRFVIFAGSLVLTLAMCYAAFVLGSWAFDTRRFSIHRARLEKVLAEHPAEGRVREGLENEGTHLVLSADGEESLRIAAETYGGERKAEVLEKGRRWGKTRIFRTPDITYVLFFDRDGIMRDFTLVTRAGR